MSAKIILLILSLVCFLLAVVLRDDRAGWMGIFILVLTEFFR